MFCITRNNNDLSEKVNIADIINNLSSIAIDKPLSAAQGNALFKRFGGEWGAVNLVIATGSGAQGWGANIINTAWTESMFLLYANRYSTNDFFVAIISRHSASVLNAYVIVNTNSHWTFVWNAQGTIDLKYYDSTNQYNYQYTLVRIH